MSENDYIENDAHLVLGLWNEAKEEAEESGFEDTKDKVDLEVIVLKNRSGSAGRSCTLTFDKPVLTIDPGQGRIDGEYLVAGGTVSVVNTATSKTLCRSR